MVLRCSQSKGRSRVDATCHCARWQVAAHKEGSRLDSLANTLSPLALSQLLLTTSLGVEWAPSVGLGWGPLLRPRDEAILFIGELAWCLAGMLYVL